MDTNIEFWELKNSSGFQKSFLLGGHGQFMVAGPDALGAGADSTVFNFKPLEIGIEFDFGSAHGVGAPDRVEVAFAADFTFSHMRSFCYN